MSILLLLLVVEGVFHRSWHRRRVDFRRPSPVGGRASVPTPTCWGWESPGDL